MQIIKLAIISFIFFFLVITGISLFIPSHVRLSKAVSIKAGRTAVMTQLNNAANWKQWYPGLDTLHIVSFSRDTVMLDHSNPLKPTYMVIDRDQEDKGTVVAEFVNRGKKQSYMGWSCIENKQAGSYAEADSVTLQWYMDFHFHWYPWEKFSSLLLENRYGPMMDKGLASLKALLEK